MPHVRNQKSKLHTKPPRVMEFATCLQPYDIMKDLDNLHSQITMRQLLAVAPQCRTKLGSAMVCKKAKVVKVNDNHLSQGLGAPKVNVTIDGVLKLIIGFQVDYGSGVILMSMERREEMGLTNMILLLSFFTWQIVHVLSPWVNHFKLHFKSLVENTKLISLCFESLMLNNLYLAYYSNHG